MEQNQKLKEEFSSGEIDVLQKYSQKLSLEQKTIQSIKSRYNQFLSIYKKPVDSESEHLFILAIIFLNFRENIFEGENKRTIEEGENIGLSDIIKVMDANIPLDLFFKRIITCYEHLGEKEGQKEIFEQNKSKLEKDLQIIQGKYRIYQKFNTIFNGLQLKYVDSSVIKGAENQKPYLEHFKCFSWLIYLHLSEEICNKQGDDIYVKNIYVLLSTCVYTVISLPQNYISDYIKEKQDLNLNSLDKRFEEKENILKIIKELFNSADIQDTSYQYYKGKFLSQIQDFLDDIFENLSIKNAQEEEQSNKKSDEQKAIQFFEKSLQERNIVQINQQMKKDYLANLKQNYDLFDETCFLKTQKVMAPIKNFNNKEGIFPSFSKNQDSRSVPQSHRFLDFTKDSNENSQGELLKQNLKESVPTPKTPQIPYNKMQQTPKSKFQQYPPTPISEHLTNIKWLNFYSNESPTDTLDKYLESIQQGNKEKLRNDLKQKIQKYLEKKNEEEKTLSQQKNQKINNASSFQNNDNAVDKIIYFYFNILEKMILTEEKVLTDVQNKQERIKKFLDDPEFLFGLLTLCITTHFYIQQKISVNLQDLLPICGASALDVYRILSNFAQFDKDMPQNIKQRLFQIERQLLLYNVFEESEKIDVVDMIEEFFNKEQFLKRKDAHKNPKYYQVFSKRLFSHAALRVYEACIELDIKNDSIQNKVWSIIKHIFERQQDLLRKTSLDYLIICSIFIIYIKHKDKFTKKIKLIEGDDSIVKNFSRLEFFQKHKINIRNDLENKNESLTKLKHFYNNVFLPPIKLFVNEDQSAFERVLIKKEQLLLSPLNTAIPRPFYQYSPSINRNQVNVSHFRPSTTPQIQNRVLRMGETIESPLNYLPQKKLQQQGYNTPSVYFRQGDQNQQQNNGQQQQQQQLQQQQNFQMNGQKSQFSQQRNLFKKVNSNRKLDFAEKFQNEENNNKQSGNENDVDVENQQQQQQNCSNNNKQYKIENNENSNTRNSLKSPKFGAQSQISNSSINHQIQMEFGPEQFSSQNDKSFASFQK
ncbi:Cyclin-like protein [Pseudocohnilembus persalinus]|uniref:Cyclin-like protein n=1 Tax=Pseudocohnilembus persalinus TaxID=266149 RepID=A0A0V0QDP3_PSEPJ|nr:Cyclin-like protein [Pseudocohnilembus persalinus]|eukprot:KRX00323.1 Cyclin-like protein [Pseudocohnilembus persalinus]